MTVSAEKKGIGAPVQRVEDARLLTGKGLFVDDVRLPSTVIAYILRSPHAHARIKRIDKTAADALPDVLMILTGEDILRDKLGSMPCDTFPSASRGVGYWCPPWSILATDTVRFVGEGVALVLAETLYAAKNAAELMNVDYEELPVVVFPGTTSNSVWQEAPDNVSFMVSKGSEAAVHEAFSRAAYVTKLSSARYPRISANAIEPRAAAAFRDPLSGRYTVHSSTQAPFMVRDVVASVLRISEIEIRAVATDVGGGFGMKSQAYPEDVLVLWAAQKLQRPVKWTGERSETITCDVHGRDQVADVALAFDAQGKILAFRASVSINLGAYLCIHGGIAPANATVSHQSTYQIPAIHATARGVFSNSSPVGPYRGTGKPEASYLIERLMDKAARQIGIDPIELRRRNLIPPSAMPYQTQAGFVYDTGEFEQVLDKAVTLADYAGFAARRAESEARGLRRGIGIGLHCQRGGNQSERAEIRVGPTGSVALFVGTHSHGQGHETMFAQMLTDWVGVPFDQIKVFQGDTDRVLYGRGSFAQRSMLAGGSALKVAADALIEKATRIAAWKLETSENDIEFKAGRFRVSGTDREIEFSEIARLSYEGFGLPPEFGVGLDEVGSHPGPFTFPNGCMICEVEIDPETGRVVVVRLSSVDDSGVVINPMSLAGQLHGATAQGLGEVLLEQVFYDSESGQMLSGSFMDYAMPRATDIPFIESALHSVPATTNPLGVKGGSESGNAGAPGAIVNAILDALSSWQITDIPLPATSEKIWRAIHYPKTPNS